MITISCTTIMNVQKRKHNFIVSLHLSRQWVKPAETIYLTQKLLMGGGGLPTSKIIKRNSVCVSVCFNSSETIGRANMKLCTIENCLWVSVIRGFVTSWPKIIFFILHFLAEKYGCLLKRKPAPTYYYTKNFIF